jgi:hypothetical protein
VKCHQRLGGSNHSAVEVRLPETGRKQYCRNGSVAASGPKRLRRLAKCLSVWVIEQDALLAGLLFCGACGSRMSLTYTKKPYGIVRYYGCGSRLKKRERLCSARALPADRIERLVAERVRKLSDDVVAGDGIVSPWHLQRMITRMTYDSTNRRLEVTLRRLQQNAPAQATEQARV